MNAIEFALGNFVKDGVRYKIRPSEGQTREEAVTEALAEGYTRDFIGRAKLAKTGELIAAERADEFGDFTVGQYTLTADEATRNTFLMAKRELDADANYTLDDFFHEGTGQFYDLNGNQITAVYNALRDHIKATRLKLRAKIALVDAATTVAEVRAITW
jgi:hypothetical protein